MSNEIIATSPSFEDILDKLTKTCIEQKITNFGSLVELSMNEYGLLGINVVSTKTIYFEALVSSIKEKK